MNNVEKNGLVMGSAEKKANTGRQKMGDEISLITIGEHFGSDYDFYQLFVDALVKAIEAFTAHFEDMDSEIMSLRFKM